MKKRGFISEVAPRLRRRFRLVSMVFLVVAALLIGIQLRRHSSSAAGMSGFGSQGKASPGNVEPFVASAPTVPLQAGRSASDCSIAGSRPDHNNQDVCGGGRPTVKVPESGTLLLVGSGLLSIAALIRRRIIR